MCIQSPCILKFPVLLIATIEIYSGQFVNYVNWSTNRKVDRQQHVIMELPQKFKVTPISSWSFKRTLLHNKALLQQSRAIVTYYPPLCLGRYLRTAITALCCVKLLRVLYGLLVGCRFAQNRSVALSIRVRLNEAQSTSIFDPFQFDLRAITSLTENDKEGLNNVKSTF